MSRTRELLLHGLGEAAWVPHDRGMSSAASERQWTRLLAWGLCVVTLAIVAVAAAMVVANLASIHDPNEANAIEIVLPIGFAILGALVASFQPRNALGWIFLVIALFQAIPGAADQYTRYALLTAPGAPYTPWILWIGELTNLLIYPAGLAALAFLLTPNGHLLSPRWRWVAWSGAVVTAVFAVGTLTDVRIGEAPVPNPTAVPAIPEFMANFWILLFLGGLGVLAVAGASVVIRLRRSRAEERLQLRWIAAACAFAISTNVISILLTLAYPSDLTETWIPTVVTTIGFGIVLPAGFGVAILRYRLYDLDLFLNRTVLYGAVSVLLLAAFAGAYVLAQRAVESVFHQSSDLVAAALGVAAGLAFGPMRRAIRPFVDRVLPARSKLTLLFTDIVESTQAIVDLGDERWRDVLHRYRALVRHDLGRFRGREVNTAGDAFFAVFDRPANGVDCAVAMRDGVKELGLRVRTGLHCGEVEMRGEQVTGLAVHAAARVMGLAGEDQVLISDDVAKELGDAMPLRDAGTRQLRGVPGEWRVYEIA
jgi:class 3 adenylate cyclase